MIRKGILLAVVAIQLTCGEFKNSQPQWGQLDQLKRLKQLDQLDQLDRLDQLDQLNHFNGKQ